jgi:hypothetical protein
VQVPRGVLDDSSYKYTYEVGQLFSTHAGKSRFSFEHKD